VITFNAEMLANSIEFAKGTDKFIKEHLGEIFLVEPPTKGLCLISSNGSGDILIYFDPDGKVVGKKFFFPLQLSSRNCARFVKATRQIANIQSFRILEHFPTQVKLSFNTNANQKSCSYKKARITLSDDSQKRFFNILVRTNKEKTFPALEHLHASKNKKTLELPEGFKYDDVDRFTELKDSYFLSYIDNLPTFSGKYLIFSNTHAVLMVNFLSDGNVNPVKVTDEPLHRLFMESYSETDIWSKAILNDFINNQIKKSKG
tara:strand:- start:762 stop:1541 length:780 start_codon:yes stop_codon:yes gene_type:complete